MSQNLSKTTETPTNQESSSNCHDVEWMHLHEIIDEAFKTAIDVHYHYLPKTDVTWKHIYYGREGKWPIFEHQAMTLEAARNTVVFCIHVHTGLSAEEIMRLLDIPKIHWSKWFDEDHLDRNKVKDRQQPKII